MSTQPKAGPRERLLRSTRELTYSQGVAVPLDAILEDAGVARRSLYHHFGGKAELIAEALRVSADVDVERYEAALHSGGEDPRQRLLAVFDALEATTESERFHGCRYTAAELSLTDPDHPAHVQTRAYKDRLHALFTSELQALGDPSPEHVADQLLLLIDGVLVGAVTRPEAHPAKAAREMAETVLHATPRNTALAAGAA
jgi:AcrR family transcriptional regulator